MTREALVYAYQIGVGGHGIERKGELKVLGVVEHHISELEKNRFLNHGIAHLTMPFSFDKVAFLVDTCAISNTHKIIGYCLNTGKDNLTLTLSSGKQNQRKNMLKLDQERSLEGFYIRTAAKAREGSNTNYEAEAFPLYKPRKI